MALVKTTGRVGDETLALVCSNVGPGGAFFSSRVAVPIKSRLRLALRAPGHNAPFVDMVSEVVWSKPPGASQPAGIAVRWLHAECAAGADPLRALLRGLLRMPDLAELDRTNSRSASFDFTQQREVRASLANSTARALAAAMRPMVVAPVPVPAPTPPAAPSPAVAPAQATRMDRVVPDETTFERRAAARRGAGLQSFSTVRPISGPHDAQLERTPRYVSGVTPPAAVQVPEPPPPPTTLKPAVASPVPREVPPPPDPSPRPLPPRPASAITPAAVIPPPPGFVPATPLPSPRASDVHPLPAARITGEISRTARPVSQTSRAEFGSASQVSSSMGGFAIPHVKPAPVVEHSSSWPTGVPRVLAERYADLALLGQGGHGVVFRARDLLLERFVVLKFLAGTGMAPEQARRYFLREFKVAADLQHPNIVRLYDIGSADGTLYYTMEYIPGQPLGHYLGRNGRLDDFHFVYSVFTQLAAALDHAHKHGVLHRDVKPNNVLVAEDGSVRLFDFGLARLLADGNQDQSMVVGTPFYMAPEMQRTAPIDARADQYALGVVLYRMLTGRVPFADGNVFLAHAVAPVPDPRVFHAELPAAVSPILMKMLAKSPEDRYPTCGAAAAELQPVLTAGPRRA